MYTYGKVVKLYLKIWALHCMSAISHLFLKRASPLGATRGQRYIYNICQSTKDFRMHYLLILASTSEIRWGRWGASELKVTRMSQGRQRVLVTVLLNGALMAFGSGHVSLRVSVPWIAEPVPSLANALPWRWMGWAETRRSTLPILVENPCAHSIPG